MAVRKIKNIVNYLLEIFPLKSQEEWDKSGFTFGEKDKPITSVVIALDLTPEVFQMAIENNSELIITHHPFIFNDELEKDFAEAPYKVEIYERLKNTKIGVLALHTNYDKQNKSTATAVAKELGLNPVRSKMKYGHMFDQKVSLTSVNDLLIEKLGIRIIESNVKSRKTYNQWAILPGAGAPEDIIEAHSLGAELVLVSDIKWSTWIMAEIEKIPLAQVPHSIEKVFVKDIANILRNKYKSLKIFQA